MHPFRLIVLGGTAFAVFAMLLPFASFPVVGTIDGISADAWPALLPLIGLAVLALTGRSNHPLEPAPGVAAVIGSGASLVFSLAKVADAVVAVRDTAGAAIGPGSFVLAAAVAVVTGGAVMGALART